MFHNHKLKTARRPRLTRVVSRTAIALWLMTVLIPQSAIAQVTAAPASGPTVPIARSPRPTATATDRTSRSDGSRAARSAFRAHCMNCHGSDGRGEEVRDLMRKIPDFTSDAWQMSRSDAQMAAAIRKGKGKSMPAMEGKLSPEDPQRLVALIRGFRGGRQSVPDEPETDLAVASAPLATGGAPAATSEASAAIRPQTLAIYQKSCLVCHGPDGQGSASAAGIPGLPDFRNKAWHDRRTSSQLAASILDGKGDKMPAFRGKLSEVQARDLVAYLRTVGGASTSEPNRQLPGEFEKQFDSLLRELEELRRECRELNQEPDRPPISRTASHNSG